MAITRRRRASTRLGAASRSLRHGEGRAAPPRPAISDDEIRASIANGQLKLQQERGTDLTIFSPRAAGMGHHLGDADNIRGLGRLRATS